jgi:alkylated DNA repair dioxygenase AlkB
MESVSPSFELERAPPFCFHELRPGLGIYVGRLPSNLTPSEEAFERLWAAHPADYPLITVHGRVVKTPRWQQAFGRDYVFAGRAHVALPAPPEIEAFLAWGRGAVDARLNGAVVNWYDARLGHYIGPHRDSREGLVPGSPVVNISLGEERPFRLRPWKGRGFRDFPATHGAVFVIPYATNLAMTHEAPRLARLRGRRVAVTLRAFEEEAASP